MAVARLFGLDSLEPRRLLATIAGNAFNDLNYNGGRDFGDTTNTTATVYLDSNDNGTLETGEVSQKVTANGSFAFQNLPVGQYNVRVIAPPGYWVTRPFANEAFGVYISNASATYVTPDAGIAPERVPGSISGMLYRDEDLSGTPTTGDVLGGGYGNVFIDLNNNAVREKNEPLGTLTGATGYETRYSFTGLQPGSYVLRAYSGLYQVTAPPVTVTLGTTPTNTSAVNVDFAVYKVRRDVAINAYNDANGNGLFDTGEVTLPIVGGAAAWADVNNDGFRSDYEPLAQNIDGTIYFNGLPTGTYYIRPIGSNDYTSTSASALINVTGTTLNALAFGFKPIAGTGSISGVVYEDANNNGDRDAGENLATFYPGLGVYADLNNNAAADFNEPTASIVNGAYTLSNLADGTYTLRLLYGGVANLVRQTEPTANAGLTVTVANGNAVNAPDFGLIRLNTIVATVGLDTNASGSIDTGEPMLGSLAVWVDLNDNGTLDTGEPNALTDSAGKVTLTNVPYGSYRLRTTPPTGLKLGTRSITNTNSTQTGFINDGLIVAPTSTNPFSKPTFNFLLVQAPLKRVYGFVVHETNGNGRSDSGESGVIPGDVVYVDQNNNAQLDPFEQSFITGLNGFEFYLPAGTYTIRQLLPGGWVQTAPANNGPFTVTITDGAQLPPILYFYRYQPPSVPAVMIEAENGVFTGGTARGSANAGYTGSGYADFGGLNSAAQYTVSRPAAGANGITLRYANGGSANRPLAVFVNGVNIGSVPCAPTGGWTKWGTVSITANFIAGNNTVKLVASTSVGGGNLDSVTVAAGTTPPPVNTASISGFVFDDVDKDGIFDSTETRPSGRVVFLDANNNGALDAGETSQTTAANGAFSFQNLAAGTYRVRQVLPTGTAYSTAAADVVLTAGQTVSALAIGTKSTAVTPPPTGTAGISGIVYNDNNANAKFDTGDGYAKGVVVFIDVDGDNLLDAGEISTTTDTSGKYSFAGLAAGTYKVRRVMPTGYTYSTALLNVSLTAGQIKTGQSIGTKKA